MRTPVDLTLLAEHCCGHGALYAALNDGRIDVVRLRRALAALPQPRAADSRLVLAVDVSNWLRPDAECSPEGLFCHTFGCGRDQHLMIPGWPYSFVAALESGRTSWCQLLDAVRLSPEDDVAEVTSVQVRRIVEDLVRGGRWKAGDRSILVIFDASSSSKNQSRRRPRRRCPTKRSSRVSQLAVESSRGSGRPSSLSHPTATSSQPYPEPPGPPILRMTGSDPRLEGRTSLEAQCPRRLHCAGTGLPCYGSTVSQELLRALM